MQQSGDKPSEKRRKLKSYDLMPGQILNPMGESGIGRIELKPLCEAMQKGNKAAAFFSELCDVEAARKGIAISRLSEVWISIGKKLKSGPYEKHLVAIAT